MILVQVRLGVVLVEVPGHVEVPKVIVGWDGGVQGAGTVICVLTQEVLLQVPSALT